MAAFDRLMKTLENLRVYQPPGEDSAKKKEQPLSSKEKITNCNGLVENISAQNLRGHVDFPKFLSIAMETFLSLCDDGDADVRMVADECLNRCIKSLLETNLARIQTELCKEMRKSGSPSRSLRAALWRFAELAHMIRPVRRRVYARHVLPALVKAAGRHEEALQETLAVSLGKMAPSLLAYTTGQEVKSFCFSLLGNLKSTSAAVRRSAASSLVLVCRHSLRPLDNFYWIFTRLLEMALPVVGVMGVIAEGVQKENRNEDTVVLLGSLLCLRLALASYTSLVNKGAETARRAAEREPSMDLILAVYVLFVQCLDRPSLPVSVTTASLEGLQQLLKEPPTGLLSFLLSASRSSKAALSAAVAAQASPRRITTEAQSESLLDNTASLDELESANESSSALLSAGLTSPAESANGKPSTLLSADLALAADDSGQSKEVGIAASSNERERPRESSESSESVKPADESQMSAAEGNMITNGGLLEHEDEDGNVAAIWVASLSASSSSSGGGEVGESAEDEESEREAPLTSCARLICANFLLSAPAAAEDSFAEDDSDGHVGTRGCGSPLKSDLEVRVSVKALALGCLLQALTYNPTLFGVSVRKEQVVSGQLIADVLLFSQHNDPQVQGTTALIVGALIKAAVCTDSCFPSSSPSGEKEDGEDERAARVEAKVSSYCSLLGQCLRGDNARSLRLALLAVGDCLLEVLESSYCHLGLDLLRSALELRRHTYWLIKVELLELVARVPYHIVAYLEMVTTTSSSAATSSVAMGMLQKVALEDVVCQNLGDTDSRVRLAASCTIVRMVPNLFFPDDHPRRDPVLAQAQATLTPHLLQPTTLTDSSPKSHPPPRLSMPSLSSSNNLNQSSQYNVKSSVGSGFSSSSSSPSSSPLGWYVGGERESVAVGSLPPIVLGLARPYSCDMYECHPGPTHSTVARLVNLLVNGLHTTDSKHFMWGTCEALWCLSESYPVTQFSIAWSCSMGSSLPGSSHVQMGGGHNSSSASNAVSMLRTLSSDALHLGCGGGPLSLVLSLLTCSPLSLHLTPHCQLLRLAGNLLAGGAFASFQQSPCSEEQASLDKSWAAVHDRLLIPYIEKLLIHCLRLLNLCTHAISDTSPQPPPKASTQSLTNAAQAITSPIKKRVGRASNRPEDSPATPSSSTNSSPASGSKGLQSPMATAAAAASSSLRRAAAAVGRSGGKGGDGKGMESPAPKNRKEADKELKSKKVILGTFTHLPHYLQLFEVTKGAYSNYKVSLDMRGEDKFTFLLRSALSCLGQILEVACHDDVGRCSDELLGYLKTAVEVEACSTLFCVNQLLKTLFGTNLGAQYEASGEREFAEHHAAAPHHLHVPTNAAASQQPHAPSPAFSSDTRGVPASGGRDPMMSHQQQMHEFTAGFGADGRGGGLHKGCFVLPYAQLSCTLSSVAPRKGAEKYSRIQLLKKRTEKKMPTILKPESNVDKSIVGAYIRLFEGLVIRSLTLYTVGCDSELQVAVIELLTQLVQVRVNYCLLDSNQVFLTYVLKQIETIGERPVAGGDGIGDMEDESRLVPAVFRFLVGLSYEKYHSKPIISMPKIIQVCDGMMASGAHPTRHVIPALEMIVQDLFITRGGTAKTDGGRDLDTQREVVISMLLRLTQYHEVAELLLLVLTQCSRENEDRWRKLSRLALDAVFNSVVSPSSSLSSSSTSRSLSLCSLYSLHALLRVLAPNVFRPVDALLNTLFTPPPDALATSYMDRSQLQGACGGEELYGIGERPAGPSLGVWAGVERWAGSTLLVLQTLLTRSSEEVLLSRLSELHLVVPDTISSSLTSDLSASITQDSAPEEMFVSFLIQSVSWLMNHLCESLSFPPALRPSPHLLVSHLSQLLLCLIYILKSGRCSRISKFLVGEMSLASSPYFVQVLSLCTQFRSLAVWFPSLSLLWSSALTHLGYTEQHHWADTLFTARKRLPGSDEDGSCSRVLCMNLELLRQGGLFVLCDYVCGNLHKAEYLTWLVMHHVDDLIRFSHEEPVHDFIRAVQSNPAASGLLVQTIHSRFEFKGQSSLLKQALCCLRGVHPTQTPALLTLLISPRFLYTPHTAVGRMSEAIACSRVEMLLTASTGGTAESNNIIGLSEDEVNQLLATLRDCPHMKSYEQLISLLEKLQRKARSSSGNYDSVEGLANTTTSSAADNTPLEVNEDTYFSVVCDECTQPGGPPRLCASLIRKLRPEKMRDVLRKQTLRPGVLTECLEMGLKESLKSPPGATTGSTHPPSDLLLAAAEVLLGSLDDLSNSLFPDSPGVIPATKSPSQPKPCDVSVLSPGVSVPSTVPTQTSAAEAVATSLSSDSLLGVSSAALPDSFIPLVRQPTSLSSAAAEQPAVSQNSTLSQHPPPGAADSGCVPSAVRECDSLRGVRSDVLSSLLKGLSVYLYSCRALRREPRSDAAQRRGLCRLVVISLELSCDKRKSTGRLDLSEISSRLAVFSSLLQCPPLAASLSFDLHPRYVIAAVVCAHDLITAVRPRGRVSNASNSHPGVVQHQYDHGSIGYSCVLASEMVQSLSPTERRSSRHLPPFMEQIIRKVTVGIARLPAVNQFVGIPPSIWTLGLSLLPTSQSELESIPPLGAEMLRDSHILAEFIHITNTVGWTNRQQFEERWANYLHLLSPSMDQRAATSSQEESIEQMEWMVLGVRGIVSLLTQVLLHNPGNPMEKNYKRSTRNRPLPFLNTEVGRRLLSLRQMLDYEPFISDLPQPGDYMYSENIEELNDTSYGMGRFFVDGITQSLGLQNLVGYEKADEEASEKGQKTQMPPSAVGDRSKSAGEDMELLPQVAPAEPAPAPSVETVTETTVPQRGRTNLLMAVDVHSCLQLLMEVFEQWLNSDNSRTPLLLINESVKALSLLADAFTSQSQFQWMFEIITTFMTSHPVEDEVITQYLVLCLTKSAALIKLDLPEVEMVIHQVELALRSSHPQLKTAGVHSALFLLESGKAEYQKPLVPLTQDCVLRELEDLLRPFAFSEVVAVSVWALVWYLLEQLKAELDADFVQTVIKAALKLLSGTDEECTYIVHRALVSGLERLVVCGAMDEENVEAISHLAVSRVCMSNPRHAMVYLRLLVTCMYTGKVHLQALKTHDPEVVASRMEMVTVLFDRVKKGLPSEVYVFTKILPCLLNDFFPAQDVLNKAIGEFLSPHQSHPVFMARLIFKVFEQLLSRRESDLLHDWIVLSLTNFAQRSPLPLALWTLACFFVAASTSLPLRNLFPYLTSRLSKGSFGLHGKDRQLFLAASLDFWSSLRTEEHRRAFISTFSASASSRGLGPSDPFTAVLKGVEGSDGSAGLSESKWK